MRELSDLEITRLCGEAAGYKVVPHPNRKFGGLMWLANGDNWNPLTDKAQMVELIEAFDMKIERLGPFFGWQAINTVRGAVGVNSDLSRAVCLSAARGQLAKEGK